MAVIRVHKTKNYTVMANYHLRDKRLSFKAKGIMSFMLSLPDEWDYSVNGLSVFATDGRDGVREALRELEKTGYLKMGQSRSSGKFGKNEYIITEKPFTENPLTAKPSTAEPWRSDTSKAEPWWKAAISCSSAARNRNACPRCLLRSGGKTCW